MPITPTGSSIQIDTSTMGVDQTTANLTRSQQARQTFAGVLQGTAGVAGVVAPFIPGGQILSAAIAGMTNTAAAAMQRSQVGAFGGQGGGYGAPGFGGVGGMPGAPGGAPGAMDPGMQGQMQILQMQKQLAEESEQFQMISTIEKTRHESKSEMLHNIQ